MLISDIIPNGDQLQLRLRRGLLIKIKGPEPFQSDIYHHFVVLNYNPTTETVIYLANSTSQVKKVYERVELQGEDPMKTVVYVKQGTYNFFPILTVFNCNEPQPISFIKMVEAMGNGNLVMPNYKLNDEHIEKIIDGVLASGQVPDYIKVLLETES